MTIKNNATTMLKLTILGSGTSCGIPVIGCDCPVCTSTDPRDKRLRTSALIETSEGGKILIDCGPDFRQQMLRLPRTVRPDAVLLTHKHHDHVGGIDDLRPFGWPDAVQIYADEDCADDVRSRFPYSFVENKYPGVPNLSLHTLHPLQSCRIAGTEVLPLPVMHGKLPILGFRIGGLVYITDISALPPEAVPYASGASILVLGALRHKPHHSHETVEEACALAQRLQARDTYLIHMCHDMECHAEAETRLPAHIHLAYDGLELEVEE